MSVDKVRVVWKKVSFANVAPSISAILVANVNCHLRFLVCTVYSLARFLFCFQTICIHTHTSIKERGKECPKRSICLSVYICRKHLLSVVPPTTSLTILSFADDGILLLDEFCHLVSTEEKEWRRRSRKTTTTTTTKIKEKKPRMKEKKRNFLCIINYRF